MYPPTPGRIVWYYADETCKPVAAIVNTGRADRANRIELTAFLPTGPKVVQASECDMDEPHWGFWSWMPYQRAKAETAEGNESESAVDPTEGGESDITTETPQASPQEEREVAASEGAGSGDEGSAPAGASGSVEG
jgi:hypothetical protein